MLNCWAHRSSSALLRRQRMRLVDGDELGAEAKADNRDADLLLTHVVTPERTRKQIAEYAA
jgi:hypothetical protein